MNEYVTLLRTNRNYLNLWLGGVITQLGDWFNLIASAELITELSDSGIALSYLFVARFLPLFVFSPFAGVLADRYDRRKLMILTDLARAATVLAFLLIHSPDQIWLLYFLTVVQFSLSALFTPARSAVLANVVRPQDLVTANALDSLTWSTMLAIGALLGGVVATLFGRNTAFVMDSMTFLLSAWFISRMVVGARTGFQLGEQGDGAAARWLELVEGFRYLLTEPVILGLSMVKAAGSLVWGAVNVLEVTFANDVYPLDRVTGWSMFTAENGSTAALGWIYLMSGLGTGLGPILMRRWLGDRVPRLLLGITIGFGLLVLGIAGLGLATGFGMLSGATVVRTVGTGVVWVFSAALLQMLVPDQYRGRVFAFEFAVLTLTQTLSILFAGILLDRVGLGARGVAGIMALVGCVMWIGWLIFYIRSRAWAQKTEDALRVASDPPSH